MHFQQQQQQQWLFNFFRMVTVCSGLFSMFMIVISAVFDLNLIGLNQMTVPDIFGLVTLIGVCVVVTALTSGRALFG